MLRPIYLRFEHRTNDGIPITTIERLTVIDDECDPDALSAKLAEWAEETGRTMALKIQLQNKTTRKAVVRDHVRSTLRNM
jgi:hypothetical protein